MFIYQDRDEIYKWIFKVSKIPNIQDHVLSLKFSFVAVAPCSCKMYGKEISKLSCGSQKGNVNLKN